MAAKDFSRDLGYLDKFLQGLRAHAATLGEPAGSRLGALLDEQDRAWSEIRGLLGGNPGPSAAPASASAPPQPKAETSAAPSAPLTRQLTVGSLMAK